MVAEKLTVVQIVPEMDEGGVEGETLDFAVYLARQGHRSIVISGGGRLVSHLQDSGVEHILWKNVGSKNVHCLKYIPKLKQFITREKVDVLHLLLRRTALLLVQEEVLDVVAAAARVGLVPGDHDRGAELLARLPHLSLPRGRVAASEETRVVGA